MNTPSTAFSERAQDRSYFFTTNLRLMSFLIWNVYATLSFALFGQNIFIIAANAHITPNEISHLLQKIGEYAYIISGSISIIYVVYSIAFGKRHWHTGPQRRAHQREWIRISLYSVIIVSLMTLIRLGPPADTISKSTSNDIIFSALSWLAALTTAILCAHHAGIQDQHTITTERRLTQWAIAIISIALAFFGYDTVVGRLSSFKEYIRLSLSIAGLISLIYLIYLPHFLTKQHAVWRNLWRAIRHDRIRSEYSPTGDLAHWINRILRWRERNATQYNYYWLVVISALIGMVVIPIMKIPSSFDPGPKLEGGWEQYALAFLHNLNLVVGAYWLDSARDTALILGFLAISSIITRRQRYIFTPFNILEELKQEGKQEPSKSGIVGNEDAEQMYSAAQHLTQQFIAQLEHIGCLLTTRQVDDVRSETRLPLAEFITSGGEGEFLAAIQSLVDIDERAKNIPGKLLAAVTKLLAVLTISGVLRRRDDVTLELEVRLTQRFGNQTSIIVPINLTHGSDDLVDDAIAASIARRAALQLLLRAGAVSHMASTEESLEAFLDGLTASGAQNWWRAAESYQHAIDIEEARRGTFGLGRFHLGVSLLRQGEFDAALENMVQAERAGKPMAEVQHMLAVMQLHRHWDELDDEDKDATFEQMLRNARRATRYQRIFPEAHHLVGAAYYHRGKLLERDATRRYKREGTRWQPDIGDAQQAYRRSIPALQRAVRQYRQRIVRLQTQSAANPIIVEELERLRRDIMTATHQLGDSLRSTGDYALAETYYEDVLAAYPSNLRTLTDMAKTYVLAQSWQRADEFLAREVQSIPEGKWSADVQLYAGWAYAGGVNEWLRLNFAQRLALGGLASAWALWRWVNHRPQPGPQPLVTQISEVLGRAVSHLDFALQQRQRFAAPWRQTDWQEALRSVLEWCYAHHPKAVAQNQTNVYTSHIEDPTTNKNAPRNVGAWRYVQLWFRPSQTVRQLSPIYITQLNAWLSWRLHQTGSEQQLETTGFPPRSSQTNPSQKFYPYEEVVISYVELKQLFDTTANVLGDIERSGRLRGIANARLRLHLAALSLDNWKLASGPLANLRKRVQERILRADAARATNSGASSTADLFTFAERWAYDIYAEISILTLRLLAEAEAHEIAWIVATSSIYIIEQYIRAWNKLYGTGFKLSPYVGRYQLATLYAWRAYSAQHLKQDQQVRARLLVGANQHLGFGEAFSDMSLYKKLRDASDDLRRARVLLDEAEQLIDHDIESALRQAPRHPLALWVKADRLRSNQQSGAASATFQRLLEVLSPYDPNKYIANWHIIEKKPPISYVSSDHTSSRQVNHKQHRENLNRHERVHGRQQYHQIINQWTVNTQLADVFSDMERYALSVQHLMLALTYSPYWDIDVDELMLRLVQQLDRMDRLRDAHAVTASLRANRHILESVSLSIAKQYLPDMWHCIIQTRRREHAKSLTLGEELHYRLQSGYSALISNNPETYTNRLPKKESADDQELIELVRETWKLTRGSLRGIQQTPPQQDEWVVNWYYGLSSILKDLDPRPELISGVTSYERAAHERVRRLTFYSSPLIADAKMSTLNTTLHNFAHLISPRLEVNRNLVIHLLGIISSDIITLRQLQAQIKNNRAYNLIELRRDSTLRLGRYTSTASASSVQSPIVSSSSPDVDSGALVDQAISETMQLQSLLSLPLFGRDRQAQLKRELAYYYDTLAWHHYRLARQDQLLDEPPLVSLRKAQECIDHALDLEQRSAIIYYHAARISLALLERTWQDSRLTTALPPSPAPKRKKAAAPPPPVEPVLENYLFAIHHYWTQARAHDYNGRFRSDLTWIGLRLDEYRQTLKERVKPTRSP